MAINFDTNKGIIVEDVTKVRSAVQTLWSNIFKAPDLPELDISPSTPQGQLIDAQTASIMNKDNELLYLANQFNINNADGIFLDALAQIYFLERKKALPTIVECKVTGLQGTLIPAGTIIQNSEGIKLVSTVDTIIPEAGHGNILFQTQNTGPIIIGANTVTTIITNISGFDIVNNSSAGVTGRDFETRTAFIKRIKDSVAINGQGSVSSIYANLVNLDGVVAVKILENDTVKPIEKLGLTIPPHSIAISIFGGDNTDIAKVIYNKKDVGCATFGNTDIYYTDEYNIVRNYNIYRPNTFPIGVEVSIRYNSFLPGSIETLIKDAVLNNFNGNTGIAVVAMGETLYSTRFIKDLLPLGINDLISVKLILNKKRYDSIDFLVTEIPTLDSNDIIVKIEGLSDV